MTRTYVVTGCTGGIGASTKSYLEAAGHRVIGVDLANTEGSYGYGRRVGEPDIVADLTTSEGRAAMIGATGDVVGDSPLDGVLALAGIPGTNGDPEQIVRLNYFGSIGTLEGLRPFLARADAPRAVVVSSISAVFDAWDAAFVNACLSGSEDAALALRGGADEGPRAYSSTKRALVRWVRRVAPSPAWAGAGITLNAVLPSFVVPEASHGEMVAAQRAGAPPPLPLPTPLGGVGSTAHIASLLAYLTSAENGFVTGQVIFADGGWDAVTRGDDAWDRISGERSLGLVKPPAPPPAS